jgi:hypothetical protein
MASLPPVSRLPRLRVARPMRAVPVDVTDLRTLHLLQVASITLGLLNLAATLVRP